MGDTYVTMAAERIRVLLYECGRATTSLAGLWIPDPKKPEKAEFYTLNSAPGHTGNKTFGEWQVQVGQYNVCRATEPRHNNFTNASRTKDAPGWSCACKGWIFHRTECKHIRAVRYLVSEKLLTFSPNDSSGAGTSF